MCIRNLIQKGLASLILAIALTGALPALAGQDGLKVTKAWIRSAPATLKTHGGYLSIANEGGDAKELIAATSGNYERVELHMSRVTDGVATMQRLESVEIPAGGKVEFSPGGMHLMLIGPKAAVAEGATVPLRFSFRSGEEIAVEAVVASKAPGGGMNHDKMDHGHGGHHSQ